jgi:tetratricopeptide (TPR) repeat protein
VADLLRTASVAGLDFDLPVLARATGHDDLEVLDALEIAGRAGLVEESGPDRYRFAHGLVRSALRDELSRSRRVRMHLRIAEALEAIYAEVLDHHADALAYHFSEARPVVGAEKAFHYTVAAADRARRLLAHADAAAAYGRALDLLPELSVEPAVRRCQLLVAQAEACARAGYFGDGREAAEAGFTEAAADGALDELVRAALAFEDISLLSADARPHRAVALLEQAEAALPPADSPRRAVVLASLARALSGTERQAEAAACAETAMAMAQRAGDRGSLAQVLVRTALLDPTVEHAADLAVKGAELVQLAESLDDDQLRIWGFVLRFWSSLQLGDLATSDGCIATYSVLSERLHEPLWNDMQAYVIHLRAMLAGDLVLAERTLVEYSDAFRRYGIEGVHGLLMFVLRREQGRLGAIAPALRTLVQVQPEAAFWRPGLVALYVELGMVDEARAEFERLAAGDFAAIPDDHTREIALGLAAEGCAAVGNAERAEQLLVRLSPCRGKMLQGLGQACLGPADRLLAMLAATAGREHEADVLFDAAIGLCRRMPSPLWLAHCLHDAAVHWAGRDPERAEMMLAEAGELCERHGLAGLARKLMAFRT